MQRGIGSLLLLAIVAIVSGCERGSQRMIRVTVEYSGESPRGVADVLARPIEMELIAFPNIDSVISISSAGKLATYAVISHDGRPDEVFNRVRAKVSSEQLPAGATPPQVELLPTNATIPAVSATEIDCVVVELNREEIGKHGIPLRNIISAIHGKASGSATDLSRSERLQAIQLTAIDGSSVPLSEVAEIRVEKQPSHIVTRLPSK